MANPAHSGPFVKQPRLVDKTAKRKAVDANWRKVCRAVDARDKGECRACLCRTLPTLAAVPNRREHHHIIPRSRGGKDTTANVCILCLDCHTDVHVTRSLEISGNADKLLRLRPVAWWTMRTRLNPSERSPR